MDGATEIKESEEAFLLAVGGVGTFFDGVSGPGVIGGEVTDGGVTDGRVTRGGVVEANVGEDEVRTDGFGGVLSQSSS